MRTAEAAGRNRETVALELNRFDWGYLTRPHYIGKVTVNDRPTVGPSGGERRSAYPLRCGGSRSLAGRSNRPRSEKGYSRS
jgi:hypothetical protein